MVSPNQLTALRLVLTPPFFLLFYFAIYRRLWLQPLAMLLLLFLFIVAELTDLFDGYLARRQKQVSNLGKILDPFADVFWRLTLFYCLTIIDLMPVLSFIFIFWREIGMIFTRHLVQVYGQVALAARWVGKIKALLYALSSFYGLLLVAGKLGLLTDLFSPAMLLVGQWLFSAAAVVSVWSFIAYLRKLPLGGKH